MNLLDLLFDNTYYLESASGSISVNSSWDETLLHYEQHAMDLCLPPNKYFSENANKHLLHASGDITKNCLIHEWSKQGVTEQDYKLIISYARQNFEKFEIALIREAKKDQDSVENLLGEK